MPDSTQIHVANTHLYPGCTARISRLPDLERVTVAIVEFADGSGAQATCQLLAPDELELTVDGYVTQKRHRVEAKHWLLLPVDAARQTWRVNRHLA